MQRFLLRSTLSPFTRRSPHPTAASSLRGLATASHHPNPGNFQNRPKEELHEIARKGGKKGGKARGVGGFKSMDPKKQRAIASRGGHAARKAEERGAPPASERPSTAPPGFGESHTA